MLARTTAKRNIDSRSLLRCPQHHLSADILTIFGVAGAGVLALAREQGLEPACLAAEWVSSIA